MVFTATAALGTALAAAYLLRVLYLVWHGPAVEPAGPTATEGPHDLGRGEQVVLAPLVLAAVALGVLPWLLLSLTGPAVRLLLEAGAG